MTIHVVGIGLEGATGLHPSVRKIVNSATLLVGSDRHLNYFPNHPAPRFILGDLSEAIGTIRQHLNRPQTLIIVLVSGDPLFFGLGRLLLAELPKDILNFHPHLSSIQLAFNKVKTPWHDAVVMSAHGRNFDELTNALQQGVEKIAILTDANYSPQAIGRLYLSLNLPFYYQFWVCENLGGIDERVNTYLPEYLFHENFAPLNVVILLKQNQIISEIDLNSLPSFGLDDRIFLTWRDRPNLMTKREVRILVLGELALQPNQVIWDIGAGTGSVSIEIARMFPTSSVYAIEKTAMGINLIEQNSRRFQVNNIISINGKAPEILQNLRPPQRIFIGGSGGELSKILGICAIRLLPGGIIVLALATLEHLHIALAWLEERIKRSNQQQWHYQILQVQLSRSIPVGELTRFSPLNPVTILKIYTQKN